MDDKHEVKHTSFPVQPKPLLNHIVFVLRLGVDIFNIEYLDPFEL